MKVRALGLLAIATALFVPIPSGAQQKQDGTASDDCKRFPTMKRDGVTPRELVYKRIPDVPGKCIRVTQIVIDPGANVGCHTHPGEEIGIVLAGSLMLQRDETEYEPAPTRFAVSRGTSMNVKNETDSHAKGILLSFLIIDENVPPLIPCPGDQQ